MFRFWELKVNRRTSLKVWFKNLPFWVFLRTEVFSQSVESSSPKVSADFGWFWTEYLKSGVERIGFDGLVVWADGG